MQGPSVVTCTETYDEDGFGEFDASSAVSWPAIVAGTFATTSFALILLALGTGLGLAVSSPWPSHGLSAGHLTVMAVIWLVFVQWISSGLGGYLTGRLRTKWVGLHTHEVFFRDTAHGFLTWAVATVLGAVILMFAASSAIGGSAMMMNGARARGAESPAQQGNIALGGYFIDNLFRSDRNVTAATPSVDPDTKAEVGHILARGMGEDALSDSDKKYLGQIVSAHTGLTQADAEKKVDDVLTQMRQAADAARKEAATVAIYTFLSMLVGAFISSAAAAIGGSLRDEVIR